tara:strand:+ start:191 stop:385 length:195 start_codon:yes stop_codon:yes gene_type:complete
MTENKIDWTSDDDINQTYYYDRSEIDELVNQMDPARITIQMITGKDIIGELRKGYWFVNKDTDS